MLVRNGRTEARSQYGKNSAAYHDTQEYADRQGGPRRHSNATFRSSASIQHTLGLKVSAVMTALRPGETDRPLGLEICGVGDAPPAKGEVDGIVRQATRRACTQHSRTAHIRADRKECVHDHSSCSGQLRDEGAGPRQGRYTSEKDHALVLQSPKGPIAIARKQPVRHPLTEKERERSVPRLRPAKSPSRSPVACGDRAMGAAPNAGDCKELR